LNGSTDIITVPGVGTGVDISTGPMSWSFWIYPTTVGAAEHTPICKWGTSAAQQQYLATIGSSSIGGAGKLGICIGSFSALLGVYFNFTPTITTNVWYHVFILVDPTGAHFGSPAVGGWLTGGATSTVSTAFRERRTAGGVSMTIGAQANGSARYAGRVAEVGFWNVLLSDGERAALQAGVPPSRVRRTNLVAYYPLYGAASPEPDLSGGHNNGVLTGTSSSDHPGIAK
jgi:hypothetical protein